jgi:hypothetical protein
VAEQAFDFESEFSLLDIGATSTMLRAGSIRPSLLTFADDAAVEAIALDWAESAAEGDPIERAFEEARRYARNLEPAAYALLTRLARSHRGCRHLLPEDPLPPGAEEILGVAMLARDGGARGVTYPVSRADGRVSFGMPTVVEQDFLEWCPLGDLWGNPFCVGDIVRFRPGDRAIEPASRQWHAVMDLTRLRIHEDQEYADEYMAFLDDLRNSIFIVAGRPAGRPGSVLLWPRTHYNPLGTLTVDASRLVLADSAPADVEKVLAG